MELLTGSNAYHLTQFDMHSTRYCITAGEATLRQKGEKRWERIERRQKAILTEYRMDIETPCNARQTLLLIDDCEK
jgi:hypothetical protein|nr:MAG TPA: hypothetical protein [Bacteriophage sp.]